MKRSETGVESRRQAGRFRQTTFAGGTIAAGINNSGNDRAAAGLELGAFLMQYPDSRQRPEIYRAGGSLLQLRDNARAAITPNVLWRSAGRYFHDHSDISCSNRTGTRPLSAGNALCTGCSNLSSAPLRRKSPKISQEEWTIERKAIACPCQLRGRLELN